MTNNNDFNSQLLQLKTLEKSQDYSTIINILNNNFDVITNNIIQKWISNEILSNDEKKYLDLYSNIQLSFVKYCFFNLNIQSNIQTLIEKFRLRLFQKSQTDSLANAVEFIRDKQPDNNNQNDLILINIMRMIDARSLAYRLCFQQLGIPPKKLNTELIDCLLDHHTKNYLYEMRSFNNNHQTISINNHHKFFLGCCTFAIALYEDDTNKNLFKDNNERNEKYICLFAKYIRVVLNKINFEENQVVLYCIRGILALLTNCVSIEYWGKIMNDAFKDENNESLQTKNPFNLDLFSLLVNKLLASKILQKKTEQSSSNEETLLLDTTLVFLVKWSDTQKNLHDDDDNDDQINNNNNLSIYNEPNQLLRYFSSHEQFQRITEILIPYIHAKYDRLRLMALSLLLIIMNNKDFEKLKKQNANLGKDLVQLIFDFINQAETQQDQKYKGISFNTLLRYLFRFLIQDFVKKQTIPYISKIVEYANKYNLYALKILRRISLNRQLTDTLLKNNDLKQFLERDANILYETNEKMFKIVKDIRQNLAPPSSQQTESLPSDNDSTCQAFISYCHEDKKMCTIIRDKLKEAEIFTKIWIDTDYNKDNMFQTIATAMVQSKVIFILLSDAYCQSDFCRREWNFAIYEKIKVYVIFFQGFDRKKYDWVRFMTSGDVFYKISNDNDYQSLINKIKEHLNTKSKNKIINQARPLSPPPIKHSITNNQYLNKSVNKWTAEDVQNWCIDNHLDQWCIPLANYDGQNLLVFREDLSKSEYIQYVLKGTDLCGIDVSRFKNEVDRIVLKTTKTQKPPTKKPIRNRRESNTSNK